MALRLARLAAGAALAGAAAAWTLRLVFVLSSVPVSAEPATFFRPVSARRGGGGGGGGDRNNEITVKILARSPPIHHSWDESTPAAIAVRMQSGVDTGLFFFQTSLPDYLMLVVRLLPALVGACIARIILNLPLDDSPLFYRGSAFQPQGWLLSRRRRPGRWPATWLWADGAGFTGRGRGRRGNCPEGRRHISGAESVRDAEAQVRYRQAVHTEKKDRGSSNVVPTIFRPSLRRLATPR